MAIERWTDERLDRLADSVDRPRESVGEFRLGLSDAREGIDGWRITSRALLQVAAQHQREMEAVRERQVESDRNLTSYSKKSAT
ncbi:hypothetical protein V0288_09760 [Pannus brasiliensis CCIBt3594]|uniref:Uncharacterized protein n=1 Tax=Pannus brasiliensis CCIBt3594 TaxID=1427578 RepID=A0AAW9QQN8_9CHRO